MGSDARKIPFLKDRVKEKMKKMKLKQSDIAELLDRSLDMVKGMFRDQTILPEHLEKIAHALECDPDYLTGKYSVTRKELKKEFGSDFSKYFSKNSFDSKGYHIHTYKDYMWEKKQLPIEEHLISFLNHHLYTVYEAPDGHAKEMMRFDFHKLDRLALWQLMGRFIAVVEEEINSDDSLWKEFVESRINEVNSMFPKTDKEMKDHDEEEQ